MATTQPATGLASFEIVVPARNEADRLPEGLAALCRKAATLPLRTAILVVDSASTDATSHIVRNWSAGPVPVGLLRCRQPGKGIAVRAGLLATRAPFVGYCDADMATDLVAMDTALRLLTAGYGAVIGSRAHHVSQVEDRRSPARKVGAAVFRTLARGIVPGVTDTQCGVQVLFRAAGQGRALPLRTAGFAFDIELIANCLRLGATLTEIPVRWRGHQVPAERVRDRHPGRQQRLVLQPELADREDRRQPAGHLHDQGRRGRGQLLDRRVGRVQLRLRPHQPAGGPSR